jgi:Spy/CpxP family protein refolding chaperone
MTRRNGTLVCALVGAMLVAVAAQAQAQRGGGGRGGMGMMGGGPAGMLMLLRVQDVQDDLQLTADQKDKLQEMGQGGRGMMQGMQDLSPEERRTKMAEMQEKTKKQLADILKPAQVKRLDEISLQFAEAMGGTIAVIRNPELAKTLAITAAQEEKIKALEETLAAKRTEMFQGMRDLSQDERTAKQAEMQKEVKKVSDQVLEILTPQQRETLVKAKGKKLDVDFSTIMPRGGGRGRRGGNG